MKSFFLWAGLFLLIAVVGLGAVFYRHPIWVADQRIRIHLWQQHVQSEYVEAGGHRIHYFEALPPKSAPERSLVLIHGLGSRGEDWSPLIPGLAAAGFHVYAPDLLGYGRSDRPDVSYSIAMEEKSVVQFLDAVHVGTADVGGWSMGGWVAMKLAVEHPDRVRRLVVYDTVGTYFSTSPDPALFVPVDGAGLNRLMAALSPKAKELPAFVAKDALRKLKRNGWVVSRSVAAMRSGRDLMDFQLYRITQPTLIVWGSRDDLIPLSVGEGLHRGIQGSVLDVIDGCGHLAPAECWRPVGAVTLGFLHAEPALRGGGRVIPGS